MKLKFLGINFSAVIFSSVLCSAMISNSFAVDNNSAVESYNTPQELVAAASKISKTFKEGENYSVIETNKLSTQKEVREYFSFFCGHCHQFLPVINMISQALPEDVFFVGNPVHYLGGAMGMKTMKAYATAVSLQVTEPFVELMNKKIFDENKIPNSDDDLALVFEELGIPKHKFLAQYNSFPVNNMANQYKQMTEDSKISGVPSVVVNNKYLIKPSSVKGEAEYYALVLYLLNLDNDFYKK